MNAGLRQWLGMMLVLATAAQCNLASANDPAEIWRESVTGMAFVQIPKHCFAMGTPEQAFPTAIGSLRRRLDTERPVHEVCLDAYWIGRHEVRRADWFAVMGGSDMSGLAANSPMTGVTWVEVQEFLTLLNARTPGLNLRLPTEAEWEHACHAKAAPTTQSVFPESLDSIAWFSTLTGGHSSRRVTAVQAVEQKVANAFGIFDMLGNAWEWVEDSFDHRGYSAHALYNPVIRQAGAPAGIRGGGIRTEAMMLRCETRGWMPVAESDPTLGFRLVKPR